MMEEVVIDTSNLCAEASFAIQNNGLADSDAGPVFGL
jgi:hypothetical protein